MNRAKYLNDVLTNFEAEDIISKLSKVTLDEFGSEKMLKKHNNLERLNMQSIKNALLGGEDFILETFVQYEKIKDLITELYLSWAFKKYIYPKIAKEIMDLNSVKTYIILYHEAVIVNLLENFFFHVTACTTAEEHIVDIIEYCYDYASKLININQKTEEKQIKGLTNAKKEESELEEMDSKIKDLELNIGLSSISIIRYLTDHLNQLPFPVRHHLMDVKDIPMILVALMEYKPWIRRISKQSPPQTCLLKDKGEYEEEIYENNKWVKISNLGNKLAKIEAQIWICLFNLFMNQDNTKKYEITEFRKSNLLRLRKYMNDNLFDQIPPLQQMYRALEEMSLMNCNSSSSNNPFIVEMVPVLYNNLNQGKKNETYYNETAQKILEINFRKSNKKRDMDLISEIYNFDNIEYFMDDPKCSNCGKDASNRCSKCKSEWYCGKDCQKLSWKKHKEFCLKLAELNKESEEHNAKNEKVKNVNFNVNKILKEEGLIIKDNKIEISEKPFQNLTLKDNNHNQSNKKDEDATEKIVEVKNEFDELD